MTTRLTWRSQRDSNPRTSLERAVSWASRRWEREDCSVPGAGAEGMVLYGWSHRAQAEQQFESRTPRRDATHRSALGASDFAFRDLAQRVEGDVPAQGRRLPGIPGRGKRARPAAGPAAQGLRRRDQRAARRSARHLPQLPAHRTALPPGPRLLRQRGDRGRDLPRRPRRRGGRARRGRVARARRGRRPGARRARPHPARQRLRHGRGGRLAPRLHRQRAVLQHRGLLGLGLRRRRTQTSARGSCA